MWPGLPVIVTTSDSYVGADFISLFFYHPEMTYNKLLLHLMVFYDYNTSYIYHKKNHLPNSLYKGTFLKSNVAKKLICSFNH